MRALGMNRVRARLGKDTNRVRVLLTAGAQARREAGGKENCEMRETFVVALLQLLPGATAEENREKGLEACRRAAAAGADLALFPEMWSNGYRIESPEQLAREAVPADGAFVQSFAQCAKELGMAIGITFLEQYDPAPRNALRVFDLEGREALAYAKAHTCDFDVERFLTPGDGFPTAELDLGEGETVRIGAMICYDREFPESARLLMLGGA